ncbi:hypothetical protein MRS_083 [Staphylococcus phage MR003]|nr:hypothetical protein MRS_083 [Staphylococcus phage MR003]
MKKLKLRLLPTPEQEDLMWVHVNHTRNVKNIFLAKCFELKETGEFISKTTSNKLRLELTEMLKTDKYKLFKKVYQEIH